MFRLFESKTKKLEYSSTPTRNSTLQRFMGGAELNEDWQKPALLPIDSVENLEQKFNSGVNRTDVPRMWGHPDVRRTLAGKQLPLAEEIRSWRRNGGEPLYLK